MTYGYSGAVFSHNQATGTTTGKNIDIGPCTGADQPPVIHIVLSSTGTVILEGSHDQSTWVDYSGGGFTTSVAKSLVQGVRFWRTRITANAGTISSSVGPVSNGKGELLQPGLATVDYSAGL
jgi:hypothetical protein